jgi:hypothetical protein
MVELAQKYGILMDFFDNLQLNVSPIPYLKLVIQMHIIQIKYLRKLYRYLMPFCLYQLMTIMGQTSTKAQESKAFSPSLHAGSQPQAAPSFEDINVVPILDPLPKRRKRTRAVLTENEHLSQAKMLRHKSTGLGKKSPKAYCPN